MSENWFATIEQKLIGRSGSIERGEHQWTIMLDGGGTISLPVPWRIVDGGRIALADQDDGQQFGLPAPVDGQEVANGLLRGKNITRVGIDPETADLSISFGPTTRLDAFTNSAGYEGWHINLPPEFGGIWVIALGGGELAIF